MKTSLTSNSSPRRRRYVPPQNPPIESELQRLCGKLAQRVPSLGTMLSEVKTIADWNDHEEEIAAGIAQGIQDDLGHLQQQRQSFYPSGTSFSEKIMAALQTTRPFWVLIRDEADGSYSSHIVMATSRDAASETVIKKANDDNGYAPDEDGGFRSVEVLTRGDLRYLIHEMDQAEAANCPPLIAKLQQ